MVQFRPQRRLPMLKRFGFPEAVFSINSFVAAMLALYIAFSIGLPRPYWAMLTVYITVQPLSGALRSKAVYRVIGTFLGGVASIVLVPNLVYSPAVLTVALALWVGLCLYISLLDRTPRSYIFLLAGYTAGIIGFPSVNAPNLIFDTALNRVEEITLGIICAALVHTIFFPRSVLGFINLRIAKILHDAEHWACETWAADVLSGERRIAIDRERERLAADITELYVLSTHLPFDTANFLPTAQAVSALQDRLSLLLPLASAVEDRRRALRAAGGMTDDVVALMNRVRDWTVAGAKGTREEALALRDACIAAEPELGPDADWAALLKASMLGRLAELIEDLQDAHALAAYIAAPQTKLPQKLIDRLPPAGSRVLHRDRGMALLSAFAAFVAIVGCSAFWIATGWPDGSVAPTFAAIITSFFATLDDPAPAIRKFLIASIIASPIAAGYLFAALPAIDGFPMLVAVLAPTFLILGALQGNPPTAPLAIAMILAVAGSLSLQEVYSADFQSFSNNFISQEIGLYGALISTQIFRSVGADWSARRILRFAWRDLAVNAAAGPQSSIDRGVWTSRMLDRLGLLIPRLSLVERQDELLASADMLNDLRIGLNVADLQQARRTAGPEAERSLSRVLNSIAHCFGNRAIGQPRPVPAATLIEIDAAIGDVSAEASSPERNICLWSLAGLRRNLFPRAEPYISAVYSEAAQ
jgi:uncharacterized membrane protein YccC